MTHHTAYDRRTRRFTDRLAAAGTPSADAVTWRRMPGRGLPHFAAVVRLPDGSLLPLGDTEIRRSVDITGRVRFSAAFAPRRGMTRLAGSAIVSPTTAAALSKIARDIADDLTRRPYWEPRAESGAAR